MNLRSCAILALALCVPATALASITLQRTYDGTLAGGEFGASCAVIGDMDGDGFAEFAIGAPGDATGGVDAGRVFIFRGGHPLPDEPTWVITGQTGERLGHSLAAARVDDDFVPDLVIGAPGSLSGQLGRVLVAYGGSPLGARPLASVNGTTPGGRFGWAVAARLWSGAQEVRIVVGAPEANDAAGEVHGLTKGDPPPTTRAFVLHGESAGERFGYAVADAGLTRGAIGGAEFLVGAPESPTGAPSAGRYALFFHDAPDDTVPYLVWHGTTAGERLGHAVTGGYDTNPNYFEPSDEFVAGAPGAFPVGPASLGRAPVRGDQVTPFDIQGSGPGSALGTTVRLLANITRSALPDLVVAEAGAVRVYRGPLQPWESPAAELLEEAAGDHFGHAISEAGTIDPDIGPHGQFLVGAPDHGGIGRVYLYGDPSPVTGVEPPVSVADVRLGPPQPNPAGGIVSFRVELPRAMSARVTVYDLAGREIARVHEGPLGPGRVRLDWDSSGRAAPGLYVAVLEAGGVRGTHRLVVMR